MLVSSNQLLWPTWPLPRNQPKANRMGWRKSPQCQRRSWMDASHCMEYDRTRWPTRPLQNPPVPTEELGGCIPLCGMQSRPMAHTATPKSPGANRGAGQMHPTVWNAIMPDSPHGHSEIPQSQQRSWADASHCVECNHTQWPTQPLQCNPPEPTEGRGDTTPLEVAINPQWLTQHTFIAIPQNQQKAGGTPPFRDGNQPPMAHTAHLHCNPPEPTEGRETLPC